MSESATANLLARSFRNRRGGLSEEEFGRVDEYLRVALSANKRDGLLLAVRARWVALAIIALLLP